MLLYICLFLGACSGVLTKHIVCNKPNHEVCNKLRNGAFPKTEAEFDQKCSQFKEHINCLEDYSDKCGSNGALKLPPGLRGVVEDTCRKDSSLHSRILQNLGCFNEMIRHDLYVCYNYTKDKSVTARQHILSLAAEMGQNEDSNDHPLWQSFRCLMQSLEMVCLASRSSSKCGSDAGDVLLEVVGRAGLSLQFCAGSSQDSLAELLKLLKLGKEEEASVDRLIHGE